MAGIELGAVLQAVQGADPTAVPDVVAGLAARVDGSDVVLYLVDFEQVTLEPLPDRAPHAEVPRSELVVPGTPAGRAFLHQQAITAPVGGGVRVWVPIVEGSDRTGVLAMTLTEASPTALERCVELGLLTGYLIAIHARSTDVYNLYRRRRSLTLSASMQWDLLPPLAVKSPTVDIAGLLEPAYEVGGDCFDYALNASTADLALFDPMGHSLHSALLAALVVGTYRHQRREGQTLPQIHHGLDTAISDQYTDSSFVTGQLARIDLTTGLLQWTNAGHPAPLLLRHDSTPRPLTCPPTVPWGLGGLVPPTNRHETAVADEPLEPGDAVLFYTDGVFEARNPNGEQLGTDQLADLANQLTTHDSQPEQIVRHLTRAVLDHRQDTLADDATFVLLRWKGGH